MSTTGRTVPLVDVSGLPGFALDARSPAWWGNTLMLAIESMTVLVLLASYLYLWQGSADWPPPNGERMPPLLRPFPSLALSSVNLAVMVSSLLPMFWTDLAARNYRPKAAMIGCILLTCIGLAAAVLRYYEFQGIQFRWDDNAYASTVWSMLGLHLVYLVVAAAETGILVVWLSRQGLDEKRILDVTLTAVYWYWTVAIGVLFYFVVYWLPRLV